MTVCSKANADMVVGSMQLLLLAKSSRYASMVPTALKTKLEVTTACVHLAGQEITAKSMLMTVKTSRVKMKEHV